jgi:hypothetical protein
VTETVLISRSFLNRANEFIEIERKLKIGSFEEKRTELVNQTSKIKYG